MHSLVGTLLLMTKLTVVVVLLTGTPGYAFITSVMRKEICDMTTNPCIRERTVSERVFNHPYVQYGDFNSPAYQNDQSERLVNKPTFNYRQFQRSLNEPSIQSDDSVLDRPDVNFEESDVFSNPPSTIFRESNRFINRPVFQDAGSKWMKLRANKALKAAIRFQQMLQKLVRENGMI